MLLSEAISQLKLSCTVLQVIDAYKNGNLLPKKPVSSETYVKWNYQYQTSYTYNIRAAYKDTQINIDLWIPLEPQSIHHHGHPCQVKLSCDPSVPAFH